ncbi:MAG: phosphoribosyltransferase [bacterium]
MAGPRQVARGGGQYMVTAQAYTALLDRMARHADAMQPRPDCVVGVIRSGLFPAVYLSHQLKLPFFCASDVDNIPVDRLHCPLLCDTSCWSGATVRRLQGRLLARGCASVPVLAMYIRNFPRPDVDELHFLEASDHIMQFWYDYEGIIEEVSQRSRMGGPPPQEDQANG